MSKVFILIFSLLILISSAQAIGERFLLWESFEDITPPSWPLGWLTEDYNGDGINWETKKYGGLGEHPQCVRYSAQATADDWFYTSALTLNAGVAYTLSFRYKVSSTSTQKMNIWFGGTQASASMTTQIYDNSALTNTIMTLVTATFTVPISGVYYIGFHCYSDANLLRLFVDDILVSYPETDLQLKVVFDEGILNSGIPTYNLSDTIESYTLLKNIGLADLNLNLRFTVGGITNNKAELSYICIDPTGDTLTFGLMVEESQLKSSDFQALAPGATAGKHYNLQTPFTFSQLGTYTLVVRYQNYHKNPDGSDAWLGRIMSNPVNFVLE